MRQLFYKPLSLSFCIFLLLVSFLSFTHAQRDPTQPTILEEAIDVTKDFKLQSIFISSHQKNAVINDKMVRVGDFLGEAKVEDISPNFVILSQSGLKFTLYLIDQRTWKK